MRKTIINSLVEIASSFGVMLTGLMLLFGGSIFSSFPMPSLELLAAPQLRESLKRAPAAVGGDVAVAPLPESRPLVPVLKNQDVFPHALSAEALLVVDNKTDTVLFAKNQQIVRPLASITKLMTALVLLERPMEWSSTTEIVADDWDGSSHHINVGERFTVRDLWHIALVGSSNVAVRALVRTSGFTEQFFVERMNARAAEAGWGSLRFTEPTGLDAGNIGNSVDVAHLLRAALNQEQITTALKTSEYYAEPVAMGKRRRVWSTNWLLTNWIPNKFGAHNIAGKTGYTSSSAYNFTVRLVNGYEQAVRIVVLGADSNESRFVEARDLANWVFDHYLWPNQDGYGQLVE